MKKFLLIFLMLFTFAQSALAWQFEVESGKRTFDVTPQKAYEVLISSLNSLKYQVLSTDKNVYITAFKAAESDLTFSATVVEYGGTALVTLSPMEAGRLFPVNIYRKIFFLMDDKIANPNRKTPATFIFAN